MRVVSRILTVLLVAIATQGCPADEGSGITTDHVPVAKASAANGVTGGVATGSASLPATNSATPTPPPFTPVATPLPTAAPLISVSSVTVAPTSLILFLPAIDPQLSLSYPYKAQLTATVVREDGAQGGVRWKDPSGALDITSNGLVSVKLTTPPGNYSITCQALDDPNQEAYVRLEVRSTAELNVIVQ